MSLSRALDVIQFIGRRGQGQAQSGTSTQSVSFGEPPVEADFDTFAAMQSMAGPINRMPPESRALIDWAEEVLGRKKPN